MKKMLRRMIGDSPAYERWRYGRKIRKMCRGHKVAAPPLDAAVEREAVAFWRSYGVRLDLAWHRAYMGVRPVADGYRYVPEDIYYAYIERSMVRYDLAEAYSDKNNYDRLFPDGPTLPVLLRAMNGGCFDREYRRLSWADAAALLRRQEGAFIIKPSIASGDGLNVRKFRVEDGSVLLEERKTDLAALAALYGDDFLIQPCATQHPEIAAFHPNSINTIRFFTVRVEEEPVVMSAVLRLGNKGRHMDNGGIPCGISAQGQLTDHATTKYFQKLDTHPVTGKAFKGFVIPGWDKAHALVRRLHERLAYFDAVGWDITIGEDETPRIVELNLTHPEINFLQVNNGPLYGARTEQVLDRVLGRRRATAGVSVSTVAAG